MTLDEPDVMAPKTSEAYQNPTALSDAQLRLEHNETVSHDWSPGAATSHVCQQGQPAEDRGRSATAEVMARCWSAGRYEVR